jgi:hypothetical protein
MYRRLDGSQRWYEYFREEKNLLSMFVFNPGFPLGDLVIIPNLLSQIYFGTHYFINKL